ncbi:MAG: hypothetical protein Q9M36_00605 [Sulfurovum sp.]|nr:hypothetical protein [Sulfurovum sp.]
MNEDIIVTNLGNKDFLDSEFFYAGELREGVALVIGGDGIGELKWASELVVAQNVVVDKPKAKVKQKPSIEPSIVPSMGI